MRIQHNIMAMSAYRNYNNNTSALSKNLEKLSSGYKINRAGDDAAGLAISEKMRAQITGLDAAQKNVKDGISLVKTAEGAMQEIHDMLNRMDYLATQSANGTYDSEVDRWNLQKEVTQLKSEIDRIAESANFNGIKLLDGTWDTDAVGKAQETVDKAQAKVDNPAFETAVNEASAEEIKGMMLALVPNGGAGKATDVGKNTILQTPKVEYQTPSFQVSMNGTSYTMVTDGGNTSTGNGMTASTDGLKLTIGGTANAFVLTEEDMSTYLTSKGETAEAGYTLSSEDLAAAIAHKITNSTAAEGVGNTTQASEYDGSSNKTGQFNDGTYLWNVSAKGDNLVFNFSDSNKIPTTSLNKYFDTQVELDGTITNPDVKAAASKYESGTYTAGTTGTATTATFSVSVTLADGSTATYKTAGLSDKADAGTDVLPALKDAEDDNGNKLSDLFNITENGGKYTFASIATGKNADAVTNVTYTGTDATFAPAGTATAGKDAYSVGLTGYINAGTEVPIAGVPSESEQLASTTLDLSKIGFADGMKITLGNETYTFAVGADSAFKDAENVVDMTGVEADKLTADAANAADRAAALSKLAVAAQGNEIFTVSHESTGTGTSPDQIGLKQKQEAKDSDMTTLDKFASYIGVSTVDETATAANRAAAVADAEKELAAAQEKLAAAEKQEPKALNLQIGDTSDSYNQLGVKIGSMKTEALGIADLSIETAQSAADSIDVIKKAINYVSGVRGDLGAYQNRLEHTGNNLSVMTENIQDAESTIRDTDVANEMMSYVKNNILVQSAQAMLAQANQVPQGVLQLLG